MKWIEALRPLVPDWTGLLLLIGTFVVTLFLRRFLPDDRRDRGRLTLLLLLLAPLLHLVASGLELLGWPAIGGPLHALVLLLVMLGVTGAATFVLFDVALGRAPVPTLVRDLVQSVLFIGLLVGVARSAGFDPSSLLTASAVITGVIGLSLQNVLSNTFAGMILQLDGTVREGDWVQIGGRSGRVRQIRLRSTALLTGAGDTVLVPNQTLMTEEVVNLSRPDTRRCCSIKVSFHHRHSPGEVRAAIEDAVAGIVGVETMPAVRCQPVDFTANAVSYLVSYWIVDPSLEIVTEGELRERIWYAAERWRLEGPCPAPPAQDSELTRKSAMLAGMSLFSSLSEDDRKVVARGMVRRRVRIGGRLVTQGEAGSSLFVLVSGRVTIEAAGKGGPQTLAVLGPGDFFGEMSLLTGEPRRASAVAAEETCCEEISASVLREVLARTPSLASELSGWLAQRSASLPETVSGQGQVGREEIPATESVLSRVRQFFRLQ